MRVQSVSSGSQLVTLNTQLFHSGVLLGEQTDSKPVPRGSNPRTVAAVRPLCLPTPALNTSSGCGGFARDPAKVEDQVRLLARTLIKQQHKWHL